MNTYQLHVFPYEIWMRITTFIPVLTVELQMWRRTCTTFDHIAKEVYPHDYAWTNLQIAFTHSFDNVMHVLPCIEKHDQWISLLTKQCEIKNMTNIQWIIDHCGDCLSKQVVCDVLARYCITPYFEIMSQQLFPPFQTNPQPLLTHRLCIIMKIISIIKHPTYRHPWIELLEGFGPQQQQQQASSSNTEYLYNTNGSGQVSLYDVNNIPSSCLAEHAEKYEAWYLDAIEHQNIALMHHHYQQLKNNPHVKKNDHHQLIRGNFLRIAIQTGNLEIVMNTLSKCTLTTMSSALSAAIGIHDMEYIRAIYAIDPRLESDLYEIAARANHVDGLMWLKSLHCPTLVGLYLTSSIACLEWLQKESLIQPTHYNQYLYHGLQYGSLDVMVWMCTTWHILPHIMHLLKALKTHRFQHADWIWTHLERGTTYDSVSARLPWHPQLMSWFHQHHIDVCVVDDHFYLDKEEDRMKFGFSSFLLERPISFGELRDYTAQYNIPWTENGDEYWSAIRMQRLDYVQWLYDHGCPLNEKITLCAALYGNLAIMKWLVTLQCPINYQHCWHGAYVAHNHYVMFWLWITHFKQCLEDDHQESIDDHDPQVDFPPHCFNICSDDIYVGSPRMKLMIANLFESAPPPRFISSNNLRMQKEFDKLCS